MPDIFNRNDEQIEQIDVESVDNDVVINDGDDAAGKPSRRIKGDGKVRRAMSKEHRGNTLGFAVGMVIVIAVALIIAFVLPQAFAMLAALPQIAWYIIAVVFGIVGLLALFVQFGERN